MCEVFIIYFPEVSKFQHMHHFTNFFLSYIQFADENNFLLIEGCFISRNTGFNFTRSSCIIRYHGAAAVRH